MHMRKKCKRESGQSGAIVCNNNKMRAVKGPKVTRVLAAVADALAMGYEGELSVVVGKATGYCETTVDHILAEAWSAERAARNELKCAVRGAADQSDRMVFRNILEVA